MKHGLRLGIVNLYTDEAGNPAVPEKLQSLPQGKIAASSAGQRSDHQRLVIALAVAASLAAAVGLGIYYVRPPTQKAGNAAPDASVTPAPVVDKSIAVLPFQNLSKEEENAFFADGVQDEILTNLAKVADLKVISRTSVLQYKNTAARNLPEIAQALKVAHVLEGSVQRSANRVRVSAQLIDARTDTHLWAERYDRDLADVFTIQSEIARAIVDQLQARLSPNEKAALDERPTADLAAYDLYLRAKQLVHKLALNNPKPELLEAVRLLDEAVARDPAFLLAHSLAASTHDEIYRAKYDRTPARLALAEASVETIERLRPNSGEAHLARATHLYSAYRDYDRAREELAKAEASLPNNAEIHRLLGFIDRSQGRWEDSIRRLKKAAELDPRDASLLTQLTGSYRALRRYSEASEIWARLRSLDPQNPLFQLGLAYWEVERNADTKTIRAVLTNLEAKNPAEAHTVASWSLFIALLRARRKHSYPRPRPSPSW
ncbi:MAG: FlgO family outer membrane protein [Verrucomicrobiota bacterium]|nr:FlgO family outer membrane protein [Verrucomicrobiota bacterium]